MKDHVVFVRVSEEDFQRINAAAHDDRLTPGPWTRLLILKHLDASDSSRREAIVESQKAAGFVNTRTKKRKPKARKKADKPRVKRGKPAKRARPPSRGAKRARKRR